MIFGACSHVGKVRKENEDSFYIPGESDTAKLFLVADGIGGENHGKLASMMVVDSVVKHVVRNYSLQKDIVRLAYILGHSSVNTTRIYTMETGDVHRRQIQKLGLLRLYIKKPHNRNYVGRDMIYKYQ